jgi:hypothetical protein
MPQVSIDPCILLFNVAILTSAVETLILSLCFRLVLVGQKLCFPLSLSHALPRAEFHFDLEQYIFGSYIPKRIMTLKCI